MMNRRRLGAYAAAAVVLAHNYMTPEIFHCVADVVGDSLQLAREASKTDAEIIVQGGVTTGLLNAVVAEDLPGPGSVFLHVDWSFKAPVRPGDAITAEVEVLEARDDKPITRLRTTITNQAGTVVLDGTALVWTEPLA